MPTTLRAGKFNRRVVLQAPTDTRDAAGQVKTTYANTATAWAAVDPDRGQEFFKSAKFTNKVYSRIRLRYRTDVRPTWRVTLTDPAGTRTFGIEAILNVNDGRQELHLLCFNLPTGEPV